MNSEKEILNFFEDLDQAGITYCLLHGWERLAETVQSDFDIAIRAQDLPRLEAELLKGNYGQLVQVLQHEATAYYFVLASRENDCIYYTKIDTAVDYRRDGRIFFSSEELLAARQRWNTLWIASPQTEYGYQLVKKVLKGTVPDYQKERLLILHTQLGADAVSIQIRLFGAAWSQQIEQWLFNGDWDTFEAKLPALKEAVHAQAEKRRPNNRVQFWLGELRRTWQRRQYPPGYSISILGPDGSGKSTVIHAMQEGLKEAFRRSWIIHQRPKLLSRSKSEKIVTDPYAKRPYSRPIAWLKIPYYMLHYLVGYPLQIYPRILASTLVLFDRYYDDILADPRRYRLDQSSKLARFAGRFVPRPDLYFILDAPAPTLLARKQELRLEELNTLRAEYRKLAGSLSNTMILDAGLLPEAVALHSTTLTLDALQQRYQKRSPLVDQRASSLAWMSGVFCVDPQQAGFSLSQPGEKAQTFFGWLALGDGRGYLITLSSRQVSLHALQIYNAQSFKARLFKNALKVSLKLGSKRPLTPIYLVGSKENNDGVLFDHLRSVLGRADLHFAVSLGTPGAHRKPVLQILKPDGDTLGYAKVGWSDQTNVCVQNESQTLRRLAAFSFESMEVPQVMHEGWWQGRFVTVVSGPNGETRTAPLVLDPLYLKVLNEIAHVDQQSGSLLTSPFWEHLQARIECVQHPYYKHLLHKSISHTWGDPVLRFQFSHGDFAPWNMRRIGNRLFVYDWEYAAPSVPAGWDIIRFLVQTRWLLQMNQPGKLWTAFQSGGAANRQIQQWLGLTDQKHVEMLFNLYLTEQLAFYAAEDPHNFDTLRYLSLCLNLALD